jgi:hypothetical protein
MKTRTIHEDITRLVRSVGREHAHQIIDEFFAKLTPLEGAALAQVIEDEARRSRS